MLNPLLNQYDAVLLDMDGVITSEQVYWNSASLTVWELLFSKQYFGTEEIDPKELSCRLKELRSQIFLDDTVIQFLKNKGVNNNWDLSWVVVAGALFLNTRDFSAIFDWIKILPAVKDGLYAAVTETLLFSGMAEEEAVLYGGLWKTIQFVFQEWFLGSELFPKYWGSPSLLPGKPGLTFSEEPLVEKEPLVQLLTEISETKRLGIGSGRPRVEAENPLRSWGVYDLFTEDAIVTYNDVMEAQDEFSEKLNGVSLSKPHPFMFLRGTFGTRHSTAELLEGQFDSALCKKTLVIGDAGCDLFSAKSAGCDFAAVLTGIDGENARGYFEENGADFILHSILDLLES